MAKTKQIDPEFAKIKYKVIGYYNSIKKEISSTKRRKRYEDDLERCDNPEDLKTIARAVYSEAGSDLLKTIFRRFKKYVDDLVKKELEK